MSVQEAVLTAAAAFVATNIDDIVILALFFARLGDGFRGGHVVLGQGLGFTALLLVSLLGFAFRFLVPEAYLGLLGLLPIALGVRAWLSRDEDEPEVTLPSGCGLANVLNVAGVTAANGADNLGIYTPLFASLDAGSLLIVITVFYLLLGAWCLLGYAVARQPLVARLLGRYGHLIMPLVLVALGIFIILESGTLSLLGLG